MEPLEPDAAREALARIDHIVVLMMENRSFDHMLGYLSLGGRTDVDGLKPEFSNHYRHREYRVFHLGRTALGHDEDPSHSGKSVARQMAGGMQGFVEDFICTRDEDVRARLVEDPRPAVMGYFDGDDLPAYDQLARHFCVCDRWFSSVPGETWPNRLYALCGESGGRKDNKKLIGRLDFPIYWYPSFVRLLDDRKVPWRWYHARPNDLEPPTIQVADARYLLRPGRGRYALFDRQEASGQPSFLDDAASGDLPSVAWIDPDFGISDRGASNDDHPPTDVRAGQALVQRVVDAVLSGPNWERTLLVIAYDEHGGFFDHVTPPPAADDDPDMRRYGPRVPAFVVSPFVPRESVSHLTFDHTSIIRTILLRYCVDRFGRVPRMTARVEHAEHLGRVLTEPEPRAVPETPWVPVSAPVREPTTTATLDEHWRLAMPRSATVTGQQLMEGTGGPELANDLQVGLLRAGLERRLALEEDELG